jgi:hypothetical protein
LGSHRNHNPGAVGEGLIDTIDLIEWAGGAPGSPLIPIKIPDDVKDWLKDNIDKINEHEKAKCDVQNDMNLPDGIGYDCPSGDDYIPQHRDDYDNSKNKSSPPGP